MGYNPLRTKKRSSSASCDHQFNSEKPDLEKDVAAVTEVDELLKRSQDAAAGRGSGSPDKDNNTREQAPKGGADKWSKPKWSPR